MRLRTIEFNNYTQETSDHGTRAHLHRLLRRSWRNHHSHWFLQVAMRRSTKLKRLCNREEASLLIWKRNLVEFRKKVWWWKVRMPLKKCWFYLYSAHFILKVDTQTLVMQLNHSANHLSDALITSWLALHESACLILKFVMYLAGNTQLQILYKEDHLLLKRNQRIQILMISLWQSLNACIQMAFFSLFQTEVVSCQHWWQFNYH